MERACDGRDVEELAWLGAVPRTLTLDVDEGVQTTGLLPASIPPDFHGEVELAAPQLFVEISTKCKHCDDGEDDGDSSDDVSNEDNGKKYSSLLSARRTPFELAQCPHSNSNVLYGTVVRPALMAPAEPCVVDGSSLAGPHC